MNKFWFGIFIYKICFLLNFVSSHLPFKLHLKHSHTMLIPFNPTYIILKHHI